MAIGLVSWTQLKESLNLKYKTMVKEAFLP